MSKVISIGKPIYDSAKKVYTCAITNGFRLEVVRENGTYSPALDSFFEKVKTPLLHSILEQTKGWFKQPLQRDWLATRLMLTIPTESVKEDFEGILVWSPTHLTITKDNFIVSTEIIEQKEAERVMIHFPEEDVEKEEVVLEEVSDVPLAAGGETPIQMVQVRRHQMKQTVMKERAKAARALFRAERLTQEYCALYGNETDWEEEESSSEEE